jgi:polyisoprenoid-binding protein YceI
MRFAVFCRLPSAAFSLPTTAQVPVFQVDQAESSINFNVSASVAIAGTFDKWDASLTFNPDGSWQAAQE